MVMFWATLLAVSILLYVLLDGFDLGVGILFGLTGSETRRSAMLAAVAPIWDGNETWLVVTAVILWGAFPVAYAGLLSAFYLPLLIMLAGLILRGVAFEYRSKTERMRWIWDLSFAGGSFAAAFIQGLTVGALVEGLPWANGQYGGGDFGWFSPYAALCGVGLCLGYSLLGACWLVKKYEGGVRETAYRLIPYLSVGLLIFLIVVFIYSQGAHLEVMDMWVERPYLYVFPVIGTMAAILLAFSVRLRWDEVPFLVVTVIFLCAFGTLALSFWPYMIPFVLTVEEAAAPQSSLAFMFWGEGLFVFPLMLLYTAISYSVFRGKVRPIASPYWNIQGAVTMATAAADIDAPRRDAVRDNARFLDELRTIVGRRHVLTNPERTRRYRTGFRFGTGPALAVVRPGNLVEQWRVLKFCAAANKIIIMQAANTGLTGGSTPDGRDYDREIVIVSTLRMARIRLINEGRQLICLPGATLFQLENALKPLGREPHSVIGSSCIGASVFGGICNNSGGALIHRGPAYTQMALFARIDDAGEVQLIYHIGVRLGNDPENILDRLDRDAFTEADIEYTPERVASDHDYAQHVRDIDADTPGRFNADPKRLFEASGSAGKVMIFAVRLDTFPEEGETKVFYVGTNDPAELTEIRRHILAHFKDLPIEGEYLHRVAFDIAEKYGKDTFLAIRYLGTDWLPTLFAIKGSFDAFAGRLSFFPRDLSDKIMQAISRLFPQHLPRRMKEYRDKYEHHLMLKMAGTGIDDTRRFLKSIFPSTRGDFFECADDEGDKAFLHRFAAAGAAIRYRAIHRREVEDIVALDVALRRNDPDWVETLPDDVAKPIIHKLYYGHFFCHVFHQDYIVSKGHNTLELEHRMWTLLDARDAQYPAEHNVGHLYEAKPALINHYKSLDPCNCFNSGIGRTSKYVHWQQGQPNLAPLPQE